MRFTTVTLPRMFAEAAWVACIVDFIIRPQYEHTGGHLYIHVSRNDKKRVKTDLGNVFNEHYYSNCPSISQTTKFLIPIAFGNKRR